MAGRIDGQRHILPVRIYFEDTDFTGLVYHASFLRFCERGRSDFVRLLGIRHQDLLDGREDSEPAVFVVRHMEIDFLKPARIDDVIEVVTECAEIGGATLSLKQEVVRDEQVLVRARVKVVLISQSGKPLRLGSLIRSAFERFVNQDG
ncbi:MAG: tol-pal system-associated acyl-CoA thioesterase [Methyloligellaceae bacterium]